MISFNLWKETPLIFSEILSNTLKASVYLKLENLHPSHSFKYRGISHFISQAKNKHGAALHAVIASGGNAGLAAACAARSLGVKCTVCLPVGAAEATLEFLRQQNTHVVVAGEVYSDALNVAKQILNQDEHAVMIPAYDDAIVWEGHASMVSEMSYQLSAKPDAIFCNVGGGGLLGGLIVGCKQVGWDDVPLIALETIGSDCFYHSMSLNQGGFNSTSKALPPGVDLVHDTVHNVYLARFNSFSSKASGSLGASMPSAAVVKMALERAGGTKYVSVADELSMEACLKFADDHKLLVELACSTTLVPAYKPSVFNKLVPRRGQDQDQWPVVVFIICGGFKISVAELNDYKTCLEAKTKASGNVKYDEGSIAVVTD